MGDALPDPSPEMEDNGMAIHKLTPRKVAAAGPGKYEDGGGLRLVVSTNGAKKWVLRSV